jgi:hypothetical protein
MCTGCARSFLDERGARLGRSPSRAFRARAASSRRRAARAQPSPRITSPAAAAQHIYNPQAGVRCARGAQTWPGARARGPNGVPHLALSRPHRENRMAPKLIARAQRARDARGVGEFDHDRQTIEGERTSRENL